MSHFLTVVIIPKETKNVRAKLKELLDPYDENGEFFKDGSRWDWWQVGGRWTGAFDGYDPEKDPRNIKPCDLCHATGKRTDNVAKAIPALAEKCNGCDGTGQALVWPSDWIPHDGDISVVSEIKRTVACHAIVTPDGKWHEAGQMGWFAVVPDRKPLELWEREVARIFKEYPDDIAVVVDCHV